MLTVQMSADPGFYPLPVGDHEQVMDAGQSQGDVQRQPGSGRAEQKAVMPGSDHVRADGDSRVDQLPEDAVPHLATYHAPECPQGDHAAGDEVDQFKVHGGLPPPNLWRINAQRSAALMARVMAAMSEPPKVPKRKPTPETLRGSTIPK